MMMKSRSKFILRFPESNNLCTIQRQFTVSSWCKVKEIMECDLWENVFKVTIEIIAEAQMYID